MCFTASAVVVVHLAAAPRLAAVRLGSAPGAAGPSLAVFPVAVDRGRSAALSVLLACLVASAVSLQVLVWAPALVHRRGSVHGLLAPVLV